MIIENAKVNKNKTFLFYDLETTGRSATFDQIVQFAAIRTDSELNELERHNIIIKINPDVIPEAGAMITHRLPIAEIQEGMCEYEAILVIHKILNTPNTINIGYNSLNFDDEFLRFSFYRNLLPSYTHQFANGCQRMDLMPMTIMYFLFKPEALIWPKVDGLPSLKLEHLSEYNKLAEGQAHNALVDVIACVELAKKLKAFPEMWDYLIGYFDKNVENARLSKLPVAIEPAFRQALLTNMSCGKKNLFQWPVLGLGPHNSYHNQTLWLRLDNEDFTQLKSPEDAWAFTKKAAETGFLLPPKERFLTHLSEERSELAKHNIEFLHDNPKFLRQIQEHFCNFTYPEHKGVDVDSGLYINGFPTRAEDQLCTQFHQSSPEEKHKLLQAIKNKNLHTRALRVLARNFPNVLSNEEKLLFDLHRRRLFKDDLTSPINHKGQHNRQAKDVLYDIENFDKTTIDNQQAAILEELHCFLANSKAC